MGSIIASIFATSNSIHVPILPLLGWPVSNDGIILSTWLLMKVPLLWWISVPSPEGQPLTTAQESHLRPLLHKTMSRYLAPRFSFTTVFQGPPLYMSLMQPWSVCASHPQFEPSQPTGIGHHPPSAGCTPPPHMAVGTNGENSINATVTDV